ncbi:MAG: thioredoxin domain-containing protein [Salinirussus sp.]
MSQPTRRNRLDSEASPYLQAHADNPVNWQPWDEQARTAAREHDVPIFLSIGYAACHWCHVMAEESFEDETAARLLNENFVPVKVDREERPDVDSLYMSICQQVTGRGGWPLSAWLTPEGEPFYVGTYFPLEAKRNQPGFKQLLRDIRDSWNDPEDRAEIENRAEQWTEAIEGDLGEVPDQPSPPGETVLETAAGAAVNGADRSYGGWGRSQKFPQTGRLHLLLRAHDRTGEDRYLDVVRETLDAMAAGGLYDHVGGGFHRYTTDREWIVPHFEKMLYDNAEIPRAFLAGYRLTGEKRYATVAAETFDFLERELRHPDGGLYSTLDARSGVGDRDFGGTGEDGHGGRVEGAYYVWTPGEVREAVDDERDAELFCDRFGVTERGNFEGRTVLTRSATVAELAEAHDLSAEAVRDRLARATEAVRAARDSRPRPPRDEKVLAGWNGLAVSALAEGGLVLDESYAGTAADALDFVGDHLWEDSEARLWRRFKDGERKVEGYLEDYAFLGGGAFDLYQTTGDVEHLAFALDLARAIVDRFWDADDGTLYFTPAGGESLIARPQEVADGSTPSSAGVAAQLLLGLDPFAPEDFADVATTVVETHGSTVTSNPLQHATLSLAADTLTRGHLELTLVADSQPPAWRERLAGTYLPSSLLAWRPADGTAFDGWLDALRLDEAPPIWAGRGPADGEPAVYACVDRTCSPPTGSIEAALDWANTNGHSG